MVVSNRMTPSSDKQNAEGNIPFEDMKLWQINYEYVYENLQDIQDYWYQFR